MQAEFVRMSQLEAKRRDETGDSFGDRLRRARTSRGLTLRQVALPAGLSITYLSDLERGVVENPTLDKLRAISSALGVGVNELIGVSEDQVVPLVVQSPALQDFAASEAFLSAVRDEAKRLRRDPDQLGDEWIRILGSIEVARRRPATSSDYLFIFEAIRRAVDR